MRYETSHPWITFSLRLPPDDFRLWLQLGEVASKVEHLSGAPLRPDVAEKLHQVYLAKGVLATTAIEGNTLSEDQVRQLLEGKLNLPPSQRYLQQEVQNIVDVCNREARDLLSGDGSKRLITRALIEQYNKDVLKGLDLSDGTVAGEIRSHSVVVGNVYRGAPAEECAYLLDRLCEWLNGSDFQHADPELRIPLALVKAVVAHLYLAWIHPFGDGNGRTARLLEFHILFASGVPLPAAHLLSDHYNLTRAEYYRQLARASATGGDMLPFIRYALQGFLDGIRQQIASVRTQQMRVAWENYVHDQFRGMKNSPTQKRRRDLVLEISQRSGWVEVTQIPLLTPLLARAYASGGERIVQRDLNAIAKLGLITRKHGAVMANDAIVQAYLPHRVKRAQTR